jgi:hypothetical protein
MIGFARQDSGLHRAAFNRLDIVAVSTSVRFVTPATRARGRSGLNFCLLDCRLGPASIVVATAGVLIHGRTLPRQSVLLPVC